MKIALLTALTLFAAFQLSFAEPEPERQLVQLTEERDRALTAATEPIVQLYRTALEHLLQKAIESNDLASAAKIKAAIAGSETGVKSPKTKPATADELKAFLAGTVWNISNQRPDGKILYTLTFLKNGTFQHSDGKTGAWSAQSARDLKLWNWDPATLNEELTQFRAVGTGVVYFGTLKK